VIYVLGNDFLIIALFFTHSGSFKQHFWPSCCKSYSYQSPKSELNGCFYPSIIAVHLATERLAKGMLQFVFLRFLSNDQWKV